ncbi:hypothetical protein [Ralstonia sp. UBA689]|uniref:hypothetical protein n=1 Tax=Ralstonia sp. UBA689 TaxID=1947373 RepID=UPI0025E6A3B1|nr:hypothetical protein [Ralstonia sp. UBA689]
MAIEDAVRGHSALFKNRGDLREHAVVEAFFTKGADSAGLRGLLSGRHFSVDGRLILAWTQP